MFQGFCVRLQDGNRIPYYGVWGRDRVQRKSASQLAIRQAVVSMCYLKSHFNLPNDEQD